MSKANKDQTDLEFAFTIGLKRMMNELIIMEDGLKRLKSAAPQGLSRGAMQNVEGRIYDLKAAILNALKTV